MATRKRRTVRRRKPRVVGKEEPVEVEEEEFEDEEEEEEEVEKPAPKRRTRRKKVVKEEPPEEEELAFSADDPIMAIAAQLADGKSLLITKTDEGTFVLAFWSEGAAVGKQLRGAAYWDEVLSPEYVAHYEEWTELTFAEKKKQAQKLKATWEPHDNPKVEVMRITQAVRTKLGIEKYKEQYKTRADRAAIRA